MRRIFPALLAIALLGPACNKTLTRPERAFTVQAPANWSVEATEETPIHIDWWSYFGDGGLSDSIQLALERNQDLVAAAARVQQAQAQAKIAGSASKPQLDIGVQRNRQRLNFVGFPIPGAEDNVFSNIFTSWQWGLNLSWEPDVWGRVANLQTAAAAEVQATQADLVGARLSLTGQTAKAWFAAIEAQRQVQIARASLETFRLSEARTRARFETGIRPSLDLRLAKTAVSQAEALLEERRQQLDAARRLLEILTGQYPSGEFEIGEDLPDPPYGVPAGLPSELVHRRPDLIAIERRLLASDANIAAARKDLRPRFPITASTGTLTNTFQSLLNGDLLVWNLLAGVSQPVFSGGRLRATVRANEARSAEVAALYENAVLGAYREVELALAADSFLAERETALEEATTQSLAAQRLAEERYRMGLSDIITLLESQRSALTSESALLNVRRLRLDNRVDLHLALGGGFSMTLPSQIMNPDPNAPERKKL